MLLLISCLLLLAQSNGQHSEYKGVQPDHGGVAPAEYRTSFSCVGRVAGYYADIESGCQLYHLCDGDGRRFTHSCPNATLFQQRMMICDHWYMVNCNRSEHDYSANLLIGQRDKPFVGDDHNHHREPVKYFSAGSLQQPNWFPLVEDRAEREQEEIENIVPSPPTVSTAHVTHTFSSRGTNPHPSQRQARNRNVNSVRPSSANPPSSTTFGPGVPTNLRTPGVPTNSRTPGVPTNSRTPGVPTNSRTPGVPTNSRTQGVVSNPYPVRESAIPQHLQTPLKGNIPDAYTSNPFFQSYISRTTPPPPPPPPPSFVTDSSRVQFSTEVQQHRVQEASDPRLGINFENTGDTGVSAPRTVPQQSSARRTKEFSIHGVHNLSPNTRNQKSSDIYPINPYLQYISNTRPPVTTPKNTVPSFHEDENEDDLNNIVELHLLDPRRMFFIPESKTHDEERGNSTVLFISVPTPSYSNKNNNHGIMHFRSADKSLKGQNAQCPRCHPSFLLPGRCHPCVIIR